MNKHNTKKKEPTPGGAGSPYYSPHSHSLNVGIATVTGNINAALIFNHIFFWLETNKIKGINQHEGRTWMWDKIAVIKAHFPYLSEKQVKKALQDLCEHGYLLKGHFHEDKMDRTNWYASPNEDWLDSQKKFTKSSHRSDASASSHESPQGPCKNTHRAFVYKESHHNRHIKKSGSRTPPPPASPPPRRPPPPSILFDVDNRCFSGISEDDIKAWKAKFPNLELTNELSLCGEWAYSNPRKNYRKSILAWLANASMEKTKEGVKKQNSVAEQHKAYAEKIHSIFKKLQRNDVVLGYKYLEFINGVTVNHLDFGQKDFMEQCDKELRKRKLIL